MASPCPHGIGSQPRQDAAQNQPPTDRERLTIGGILRAFLPDLLDVLRLGARKLRVLLNLGACGQPDLLGHCIYECPECKHHHWTPRSCGDRHCPRCLSAKSRAWLDKQMESLLPVTYYHCVFTLPQELNSLLLAHQKELYPLLFECAAQSLLEFGRNRLGGEIGITAVLHTWGQKLDYHPHLHCIVTGGALREDGKAWRPPKQRKFLFPVKAVASLFRGKFLDGVRRLLRDGKLEFVDPNLQEPRSREKWLCPLYQQRWVVYAKQPFGGPGQVLRYLANYTHRVAISNRRVFAVDEVQRTVTVRYRDYRDGSKQKLLCLTAQEFIRRFTLHILPHKLVRIRHYGILGNNRRKRDIAAVREILAQRPQRRGCAASTAGSPTPQQPATPAPFICPVCEIPLRFVALRDRDGVIHSVKRSSDPYHDSS
jgi:hypothetical protein